MTGNATSCAVPTIARTSESSSAAADRVLVSRIISRVPDQLARRLLQSFARLIWFLCEGALVCRNASSRVFRQPPKELVASLAPLRSRIAAVEFRVARLPTWRVERGNREFRAWFSLTHITIFMGQFFSRSHLHRVRLLAESIERRIVSSRSCECYRRQRSLRWT